MVIVFDERLMDSLLEGQQPCTILVVCRQPPSTSYLRFCTSRHLQQVPCVAARTLLMFCMHTADGPTDQQNRPEFTSYLGCRLQQQGAGRSQAIACNQHCKLTLLRSPPRSKCCACSICWLSNQDTSLSGLSQQCSACVSVSEYLGLIPVLAICRMYRTATRRQLRWLLRHFSYVRWCVASPSLIQPETCILARAACMCLSRSCCFSPSLPFKLA